MLQGAVELGDHLAHGLGHLADLILLLYTDLDGQVLFFSDGLQGQGCLRAVSYTHLTLPTKRIV